MGKNKSSVPCERRGIWKYYQKFKNIAKTVEYLKFSWGKVKKALQYFKKYKFFENLPGKKPRKTTPNDDKQIVRMSKVDPFLTSCEIRAQIEQNHGVRVSAQTVRRRLQENSLNGRIGRSKPIVTKRNIKRRLAFAREHLQKDSKFWELVVWSDESKFNVFGNDGRPYVRRPPLPELNPRYTKKTVKQGGSSVMV